VILTLLFEKLALDVKCRFLDAGGAWSTTTLGKVDGSGEHREMMAGAHAVANAGLLLT